MELNYSLNGHEYEDEIISILQLFYHNKTYVRRFEDWNLGFYFKSIVEESKALSCIYKNGELISSNESKIKENTVKDIKRNIKLTLFKAIENINPLYIPWGIITGIRPAKRVHEMWDKGMTDAEITEELENDYLVSKSKIDLTFSVANAERQILENNHPQKISLYIGVPFCPTRCLYCSFTSYSMNQYSSKVQAYLDSLEKEMKALSKYASNLEIENIYIGGGTPTSLNEIQLDKILSDAAKYFKKPVKEFTVEAGRADTITRDKLKILKDYGVSRISINPQTMNDKTLRLIGREHTVDEFRDAYHMAREEGHKNINTDIILGLPQETLKDVEYTFEEIKKLNPESVTVHTLAVKRASRLKETLEDYELLSVQNIQDMLDLSAEYAELMEMYPYYMYRQKNMLGNFENVGYCKKNYECIYNIQIMEERQTILALGAGGSTKVYFPEDNNVERIFNVKSVDDYIMRTDEMIDRKRGLIL